jgi:hypothetical protein
LPLNLKLEVPLSKEAVAVKMKASDFVAVVQFAVVPQIKSVDFSAGVPICELFVDRELKNLSEQSSCNKTFTAMRRRNIFD